MKTLLRLVIAVIFLIVSCPCGIFADDDCAPYKAEAGRLFKKAQAEYSKKNFEEALELYERAKRYYRSLAAMECEPRDTEFAKKAVETCKKNIANSEDGLEKMKKFKAEEEAVEQFNHATARFNEGLDLRKERKWGEAKEAFEEAARAWDDVASSETKIAEKAKKRVEKAEELAEQSQKRSDLESESKF